METWLSARWQKSCALKFESSYPYLHLKWSSQWFLTLHKSGTNLIWKGEYLESSKTRISGSREIVQWPDHWVWFLALHIMIWALPSVILEYRDQSKPWHSQMCLQKKGKRNERGSLSNSTVGRTLVLYATDLTQSPLPPCGSQEWTQSDSFLQSHDYWLLLGVTQTPKRESQRNERDHLAIVSLCR